MPPRSLDHRISDGWRGVLLVVAAVLLAAGAHAGPPDSVSREPLAITPAVDRASARASVPTGSGPLERREASSVAPGTLARSHDGRISVAATGQRNEPSLPPPARADGDALERAEPSHGSGAARAPQTLRVCPPGSSQADCRYFGLQDALAAALPGDQVVLAAGVYAEGAVIDTPNLVLRGEPGAHLRGHAVEGKAALVVKGNDVMIEGIECSEIAVRDNNGACIRIEGDDLTVRNVHFHDNQQGILSGPGGGVLLVEDSLLERNGFGGRAHGVYIGATIEAFIFRNNRILATTGAGHGLKSRAQRTIVENNVIASLDGHDSRALDVPNGGEVVIRGNVLEKGPNSENAQLIGLALEGSLHDLNQAVIEDNLMVFDTLPVGLVQSLGQALGLMPPKGIAVASDSPGQIILRRNTIVGARAIGSGVVEQDNRIYQTRREAGLPPYPALPEAVQ